VGQVSNEMFSGLDWFPTLLAPVGDTGVKDRLLKGSRPDGNDTTFRNHLDGFNQLDYLTGKSPHGARTEFAYFNDDGDLVAYRYNSWKAVVAEMKKPGGLPIWHEPFTQYRIP
jgi:arylsulfatase